jgi:hypothetical protein
MFQQTPCHAWGVSAGFLLAVFDTPVKVATLSGFWNIKLF